MKKVKGTLIIHFKNGTQVYYENVENFNLVHGYYYIWLSRNNCIKYFPQNVRSFYYSYTKY